MSDESGSQPELSKHAWCVLIALGAGAHNINEIEQSVDQFTKGEMKFAHPREIAACLVSLAAAGFVGPENCLKLSDSGVFAARRVREMIWGKQ